MEEIVVGKHTLESLTTGMYSDPFVIFREYIQNAADSLDEAISEKIITDLEKRIAITLDPIERIITIEDNGVGIRSNEVVKNLVSIGNSKKINLESRGFRGIGRLSGLSYCSKLSFETTAVGDSEATSVIFNAKKMSEILSSRNDWDTTILDVLNSIYQVNSKTIGKSRHYFKVTMEGVDSTTGLLNEEKVKQYISQTGPVPYSPSFTWGKEIHCRMKQCGYCIPQYRITICKDCKETSIYKPYEDYFFIDKRKSVSDRIRNIGLIQVKSGKDDMLAVGWIAQTEFKGSIYDKSIRGIRIRKGNVLIGDYQTLNGVFKDSRFNGWSIGEIFVISPRLIPNARRDDFEKNDDFYVLFETLKSVAERITRTIRGISVQNNVALSKAIDKTDLVKGLAQRAVTEGLSSVQKRSIQGKLADVKKTVKETNTQTPEEQYHREIAFDELDMLIGQVKGTTSFKSINTLNKVNSVEKRILERVFNALISTEDEHVDDMIEAIIAEFSKE